MFNDLMSSKWNVSWYLNDALPSILTFLWILLNIGLLIENLITIFNTSSSMNDPPSPPMICIHDFFCFSLIFLYNSLHILSNFLVGFPFFSAYYSKDLILEVLYLDGFTIKNYAYFVQVFVVFLTSFYSFRLIIYVFHGQNKFKNQL